MNEIIPAPEWLEVANTYLQAGDIDGTARMLALPVYTVTEILGKREVRAYLNQIYMDLGYRNKHKIAEVMDKMIQSKLDEAEETGIYTNKDLAELMVIQHKMRMEEIKATQGSAPSNQTNVQINEYGGGNYGDLMAKLMRPA